MKIEAVTCTIAGLQLHRTHRLAVATHTLGIGQTLTDKGVALRAALSP